ncbi:DUF1820 family protein [Luteimonas abyssi]|uniref:DUF1820 family protein n=1 Tax=Luteimonas abyssi TaxID=1247514 RepID=UPI000737D787|nr:DUF1820 family protein [Luteimonas abyssi]
MFKSLYKVSFLNLGKVYEVYARQVASGSLWGFVEVADLVFDVHDGLVVDPTEERLRDEFAQPRVLPLPMQSVLRVEEVERKGQSAIRDAESGERVVTPFPLPAKPR